MLTLYWLEDRQHTKTYGENSCEGHVIVDAAVSTGPQRQADEPHAGHPELVVRRRQVLQVPQLLRGHQTCETQCQNMRQDLPCQHLRALAVEYRALTCLHQVLHGGEPLVDGGAHGTIDEYARQVCISHQGAPG